ncbi:NAD(P)-dependent oxidoreductase [Archangium violaceum]|uniref:NAD(P)-dependent oxidoreductase n=1 Tax=Archangium violaceum TaxID=83451 RepID=UPI0036D99A97
MRLTLFGATGPTGLLLTQGALERGYDVTVLVRRPEAVTVSHPKLRVLRGDVQKPETLPPALQGQDAVISTIGLPYTRQPVRLYSEGTRNIMAAMKQTGVERLIVISSGGTAPGVVPESSFFFERILKPLFRGFYDDMRKMEVLVQESGLRWTVLRPPELRNVPARGQVREGVGKYVLPRGLSISRADLARFTLDCLTREDTVRQSIAVAW